MITPAIEYTERCYTCAAGINSAGELLSMSINSDGLATACYRRPARTGATVSRHFADAGAMVAGYGVNVQAGVFYVRFSLHQTQSPAQAQANGSGLCLAY